MPIWDNEAFMRRRAAARERLDRLTGNKGGEWTDRSNWFRQVYELAGGDAAQVPWADLEPKSLLVEWLGLLAEDTPRGKAVDVACGLGDNAQALAAAGFEVTAFDLSETAVTWARNRFPDTAIRFLQADLFDLPADFTSAFDLVHETYTIQSLSGDLRQRAVEAVARMVAPQGRLLLICRARDDEEICAGPPWPVSKAELAGFGAAGLRMVSLDDVVIQRDRPIRHFRALFTRE